MNILWRGGGGYSINNTHNLYDYNIITINHIGSIRSINIALIVLVILLVFKILIPLLVKVV